MVIESGITSIGRHSFSDCPSLTSVTIPATVTSIGDYAFSSCTSLTSVTIPDNVRSIGVYAFKGSRLTSVTIPDKVTSIGDHAFYGCESLTKAVVGSGVTSIDSYVFSGCSNLTSVTLPDGLISLESYAFSGCSSLRQITIPDGVVSIGGSALNGCSSLTTLTIPDSVVSLDESWTFSGCTNLKSVVIGSGVTSIGYYAFNQCSNLTSVTFSSNLTSIAEGAFNRCSSLTSIAFPAGLISIGYCAFDYCTGLTTVYFAGTESEWGQASIGDKNTCLTNAAIYYECTGPVSLSGGTLSLSASSYTYDGTAKKPGVTVKYGGTTLTEGTDYSVAYVNNTNVGTATVTVMGTGRYTGLLTKTFTIGKTGQTVTATAASSTIYVGKTTSITASGYGTITYSSSDKTIAKVSSSGVVTGKSVGKATITVKASGDSTHEAATKKVTVTVKLATPTISSLTNTSSGIKIKWSKVSGADGYQIYRKSSSGSYKKIKTVTSGSTVSYTDTAVKSKNGTAYTYAVKAYSGSSTSSYKGVKTVRLTGTSLSGAKNSSSKKAAITWKKSSGVTGYQLQYSTSQTFASGNKTKKVAGSTTLSKTLTSLTKGKTYYVRIRTYKTSSGKTYCSAWSAKKKVKISK